MSEALDSSTVFHLTPLSTLRFTYLYYFLDGRTTRTSQSCTTALSSRPVRSAASATPRRCGIDFAPSCDVTQTKQQLRQIPTVDPKWMASWTVVLKETVAIAGGSATTIASRGIAGSKSDSFLHLRTGVPV